MFNKEDLQTVFMSILLTGVIVFALSLMACQDNYKKQVEESAEFADVNMQKIEKGELISKAVCTESSKNYTILTNIKTPLKIESEDKYFYLSYTFKLYLLPDKTYSGSLTVKGFDTASNSPIQAPRTQALQGLWSEKNNMILLMGLGKIRKIKSPVPVTENPEPQSAEAASADQVEKIEPKFVNKVELMIDSLVHQSSLNKKITELTIESASEGPNGQKLDEICAPVQ